MDKTRMCVFFTYLKLFKILDFLKYAVVNRYASFLKSVAKVL